MPVSLTTLTGPIYMPNGATPVGGRVSFELSSWDREEGEALIVSGPTYSNIDENGQFSVELFTTTEGVNTVSYKMYVLWEDSELSQSYVNNVYVNSPVPHYTKKYIGSFALAGAGPFQVSDLNIVSELELNSFDVLLECKAYSLAASTAVSTAVNEAQAAKEAAEAVEERIDLGALDAAVLATATDALAASASRIAAQDAAQEATFAASASRIAAQDAAQEATFAADARDLSATYAGITHRAPTYAVLSFISGTVGQFGYVDDQDTGTHADPITGATVPNAGIYQWAANGLGALQARWTGSTGLAAKLSISDAPFVAGAPESEDVYMSVVDADRFGRKVMGPGLLDLKTVVLTESGLQTPDFDIIAGTSGKVTAIDLDGFGFDLTPDARPVTMEDVARIASETVLRDPRPFSPVTTPLAQIIAHRGLWGIADIPENSLDGVAAAAAAGFDGTETDCVITSDGVFVICHDETLDAKFRTAGTYEAVSGVSVIGNTLATLRAGYVLASANPTYRRPIPTLEEYLDECLRCGIKPYVELKANAFSIAANVEAMADLMIGKMGVQGCAFLSFVPARLDVVRAKYPNAELLYIHHPTVSEGQIDHIEAQNATLFPSQAIVTRELVDDIHRRGMKMASWVVLPSNYNRLVKLGVDTLVADFIPPRITNQKVLITARAGHLHENWDDFTTAGTVNADGTLTLSEGQTVALDPDLAPVAGKAGVWARVQFTGALTGNIGVAYTLEATETTASGVYAWVNLPAMYAGSPPQIRFTAGAGGATLRLLDVTIINIE